MRDTFYVSSFKISTSLVMKPKRKWDLILGTTSTVIILFRFSYLRQVYWGFTIFPATWARVVNKWMITVSYYNEEQILETEYKCVCMCVCFVYMKGMAREW